MSIPVAKAVKREKLARTLVRLFKERHGYESRTRQLKQYRKKGGNICDCCYNCLYENNLMLFLTVQDLNAKVYNLTPTKHVTKL